MLSSNHPRIAYFNGILKTPNSQFSIESFLQDCAFASPKILHKKQPLKLATVFHGMYVRMYRADGLLYDICPLCDNPQISLHNQYCFSFLYTLLFMMFPFCLDWEGTHSKIYKPPLENVQNME